MTKPEKPTWQVELDGVGYCWNGETWYEEKTRQIPPTAVTQKLQEKHSEHGAEIILNETTKFTSVRASRAGLPSLGKRR